MSSNKKHTLVVKGLPQDIYDDVIRPFAQQRQASPLVITLLTAYRDNEEVLDSLTMRTQQGMRYFEQVTPAQPQVIVQAPPAQPEQNDRIDKLESLIQDLLRTQQKPQEPQQVQVETSGSDDTSPWVFPTGDNEDDFAPRTDDTHMLPTVEDPEPAPEPVDTANAETFFGNLIG